MYAEEREGGDGYIFKMGEVDHESTHQQVQRETRTPIMYINHLYYTNPLYYLYHLYYTYTNYLLY